MTARKVVNADEWLYRRSWPDKKYMNPDGTATSRVFKLRPKDNGELSVDIKSLTTPDKAVGDSSRFYLFELSNRYVLQITDTKLVTYYDPLPDGSNNAHAVIVGMVPEDDIIPALLAKASKRVFV
ncbi:MAG: hypothetical protein SF052_12215 [Bacteroidia bacterium]|nr:hypothetical protein [Bacteroidia bacterium]